MTDRLMSSLKSNSLINSSPKGFSTVVIYFQKQVLGRNLPEARSSY